MKNKIITFINTLVQLLGNDSDTNVKKYRRNVARRIDSNCKAQDSRKEIGNFTEGRTCRIPKEGSARSRLRICLQTCQEFCMAKRIHKQSNEEPRGTEFGRKEGRKTKEKFQVILKRITLTIFYFDLIDTYPAYSIFMLKELWLK